MNKLRELPCLTAFLLTIAATLTTAAAGEGEPSEVEEYLTLFEKGFVEEAIAGLKSAKAARPEAIEPPFYLGCVYGELRMYKEAAGEFRNCLEINPDLPDVHYNLGTALNGLDLAVTYEELDSIVAMRMWENYVESIENDESARPYYDAAIKRMERLRERAPGP
jgi:tetratricopeptide (TPR) repeat protein